MKCNKDSNTNKFSVSLMQNKMHEFTEAIKSQMSKIEPVFLLLGQDMQNSYCDSAQLTETIEQSADILGNKTEGTLVNQIQNILNGLLDELKDCRDIITDNAANMGSSTDEITTLSQICTGLTKIGRFLNIVGMNIDVESCRSMESKNMFHGFGGEVKELAHKIVGIADRIDVDSTAVQSKRISGVSTVKTSLQELSTLSSSGEKSVRHAMDEVERLTQFSYTTLENAATHSQAIQKQVGDIVMAIQFHDIVRQKLEHVISAFEDCKTLLDQNGSEHDLQSMHAQIYFILKVQSAQLSQITSELNTVHNNLEQAFTRINDKTDQIMDDIVGSGMDKKEANELEHQFDSIKKALENLKELRTHGQQMAKRMMESIKETSSIISGLSQYTSQVSSININLQYKALNAIIMTSKLGEKGRTLEVLAREVRLISLNSNELMEQTVKTLKAVTEMTGNLKELNVDNADQTSDSLTLSLESTLKQITTTLKTYEEKRSLSVSMAEKLGKNIQKTKKRVSFISKWAEDIRTIQTQINGILGQIQPLILSMDKKILIEHENMAKRYTMESERKVLLQTSVTDSSCLNEDKPESHSQDNHSARNQDDDDLDDNIELF